MNILSDNPSAIKKAFGDEYIHVEYSPALDVYTKSNQILRTLKGMYFSSKLDLTDQDIIDYIRETAKPMELPEPYCHTCYNYEDFDNFCKKYIDNCEDEIKVAYDVETTAAPYLSNRYKLAGFSLATVVSDGCYVILDSIDYTNPDKELIINRLENVIRTHNMLVFNAQHEYIATKRCVNDLNLKTDSKHLDDAYSMALLLKTESFKADVFKLKLLSNRLLGIGNWATIIDDYIELAMDIASDDKYDFKNLDEKAKDKIVAFRDMLKEYDYNNSQIILFINKLQDSYEEWKEQDTIPYSLIPSKIIAKYGCYDSCYLLALFDYLVNWSKELEDKLSDSLNKPNIKLAYEETVNAQIMSAILTLNGICISEDRDDEVELKSKVLAEEHYNKLWEIESDTLHDKVLYIYAKNKFKDVLRKKYILPYCIEDLIPEGFKFIKTTPSLYSFECEILDHNLIDFSEYETEEQKTINLFLEMDNDVKVYKKDNKYYCKLLQKHLLPYETLSNESELLDKVFDEFLNDSLEKNGSLSVEVFKPMSGPAELFDILTKDLQYANFIDRVVLFEYHNLPEKLKDKEIDSFFEDNLLYNFNDNVKLYHDTAEKIKSTVMTYLSKSYPHKKIYEDLLNKGIKSFASPIIAYIYNVFTATGCTVDNPIYSAFNFICQLKICRKYLRVNSTFVYGSSGGYASQMRIKNESIDEKFLELDSTSVLDETTNKPVYKEGTSNFVFGKWYANTADTGRWQATIHNVPAGAYCKRRFVSRFPGGVILANDMSQAEVRELAAVSRCEKLLETVKDPTVDIHKRTASLAFDVPYEEVTGAQRKQTKEGIFSIVYGRELDSLAQSLFKGDKTAAKRLMDSIFKVYPEIPEYLADALEDAKKHGYLVTRRGAPIFINPYSETGLSKGEQAFKRNVQNYAIQGGASYWCTDTLVNIQKLIDKYNLRSKIICYIHDSIEVDCPPEEIDTMVKLMNYAFNELATKQFEVPTSSDTVISKSMGEELKLKRIEANHYTIEGNNPDILELFEQFETIYNVEIIDSTIEETIDKSNDVDWCFTPRAEFRWYDKITPAKYEIKLNKK